MYNRDMTSLPLFPLNTVLFPGQLLPLHIFEDRYRQMIGECLQTGGPFGVVLIRDGDEVGDPATEPYPVGTTAQIVQAERLSDGGLNIICVGTARFRIQQTYHDQQYLRGEVDLWPWQPLDAGQAAQRPPLDQVRARLDRYIQVLSKITQSEVDLDLPEDAAAIANLAAAVLQISVTEKQALLSTDSIGELLDRVAALLQHELRDLQIMYEARVPLPSADDDAPFSLN
jgi:Lon protease-like protein